MIRSRLLTFARILLGLSFVFLITGLYLNYVESKQLVAPTKGTIAGVKNSNITISTLDPENDNSINSPDDIQEGSGAMQDKPPLISGDNSNVEFIPDIDMGLTNKQKLNDDLRKKIEDTYGIEVKYGQETAKYTVSGMSVVSMTDPSKIQKALSKLNSTLMLYPNGFFKEFSDENLSLKIYLVQRYSKANITGITELTGDVTTISIATDYDFSESFHHEIYHYIEHFIERKSGQFSIWNTYNPSGFVYGKEAKSTLSFNRSLSPSSPFVNNYAQTNADEDRASTFEYMTAGFKPSCFDSKEYPIWKKASYMSLMIDTYFDTVSPNVIDYWERFIY